MLEAEQDADKFEEKFEELENEIAETLVLANGQYAFYFSFSEPGVIPDDETLSLQKFLRKIKVKSFFFYFPDDYDDIEKNRPHFLEELSFDENEEKIMPEMKKASIIYNILKNFETIDYVNVLDIHYNASLVRILKSIEDLVGIKFSLNFGPEEGGNNPFTISQYAGDKNANSNSN